MRDPESQPWRSERRQRIIAAAGRLFGAAPYRDVQMDDIARAAHVGKPTLYRYFASKEELFVAVLADALRDMESRFAEAAIQARTPAETLRTMIRLLASVISQHLNSLRALNQDSDVVRDRWRRLYRERRTPIVAAMRRVIEAGIEAGEFRPIDPEIVPTLVIGLVRGGLTGRSRGVTHERVAEAAIDLILGGLLAAPGAAAAPRHDPVFIA